MSELNHECVENKKVYVVTKGCYSDYRILRIFDNRADAEKLIEIINKNSRSEWDEASIEEYTLGKKNNLMLPYVVQMNKNGDLISCHTSMDYGNEYYQLYVALKDGIFTFSVWARDEEHAIKIANDHRAVSLYSSDIFFIENEKP